MGGGGTGNFLYTYDFLRNIFREGQHFTHKEELTNVFFLLQNHFLASKRSEPLLILDF